jgi:hypothetical protein
MHWLVICVALAILGLNTVAVADMGPPVHMQVTETEERLYAVQWRVPKMLPPRAVPIPMLPETCRPVTEATVVDQPAAWLVEARWQCDASLAGQIVGMDYPYPDLSLTTVVRVDLLSGDRFARVLNQGEESWQLPQGTAAPDVLKDIQRAVLAGGAHTILSPLHLVFLLVLGLMQEQRRTLRLVSAFALGQIIGVLASGAVGASAAVSEVAFAVGIVVIARQVLQPEERRRRLSILAALVGLSHGIGLASMLTGDLGEEGTGLVSLVCASLGVDAVHIVIGVAATALLTRFPVGPAEKGAGRALPYAAGAFGVAAALTVALQGGAVETGPAAASLAMPADTGPTAGAGTPGSRRLAPATPNTAVSSFLSVEPFETRHEVMLRLAGLTEELGLDSDAILEIGDQPAVAERLAGIVLQGTEVLVDGKPIEGQIRRADFMTVDPTGALPRPNPVPEPVLDAVMGVIVAYPTPGMPRSVDLEWRRFPAGSEVIPGTVIDPENVSSTMLSPEENRLSWRYALLEDPIPTVEAVPVEPMELPLPWLSLPLLLVAGWLVVAGIRRERSSAFIAAARVVLALALLVGPLIETAVAVPGSSGRTPSERQARRILAGLLPNIYRALEFRSEEMIYDRLAISVTGDTLSQVYLEQRRTLEVEERGGAQARVEAVEILSATEITTGDPGFGVRAEWTVGGMVTHFGHRHFRQNRYNAVLDIVPVDETWKIRSIEILETERLK